MANGSIVKKKDTGIYQAVFRFAGKQYWKTLKTTNKAEAKDALGSIRNTIRKIEAGDLIVPADAEVGTFITSFGKLTAKADQLDNTTLQEIMDGYVAAHPAGSKADNTFRTEACHRRHLLAHFGGNKIFRTITNEEVQKFVTKRAKTVTGRTIKKELITLRLLWHYAASKKIVAKQIPFTELNLPVDHDKAPFATYAEIQAKVELGGLTEDEVAEAWECLFLSMDEIREFLKWAAEEVAKPLPSRWHRKLPGFLVPMCAAAGFTGARRSELVRSEVSDWNLDKGTVAIREMKKKRKITFRHIQLLPELVVILKGWMAVHPGGRWMFCEKANVKMRPEATSHRFEKLRAKSEKWKVIHGYHTFRHSFASVLASKGVRPSLIDDWMGHVTEEMSARYRHLFPSDQALAIAALI